MTEPQALVHRRFSVGLAGVYLLLMALLGLASVLSWHLWQRRQDEVMRQQRQAMLMQQREQMQQGQKVLTAARAQLAKAVPAADVRPDPSASWRLLAQAAQAHHLTWHQYQQVGAAVAGLESSGANANAGVGQLQVQGADADILEFLQTLARPDLPFRVLPVPLILSMEPEGVVRLQARWLAVSAGALSMPPEPASTPPATSSPAHLFARKGASLAAKTAAATAVATPEATVWQVKGWLQVGALRRPILARGQQVSVRWDAHMQGQMQGQMQAQSSAQALPPHTDETAEWLSLQVQDIDVRGLLQWFAQERKFNLLLSDAVQGTLSLHLQQLPWSQALEAIVLSKGWVSHQQGRVLWVGSRQEWSAMQKAAAELSAESALAADAGPLLSAVLQLHHARSEEVAQGLWRTSGSASEGGVRLISNRGGVVSEPRTNQLLIRDVAHRVQAIQEWVSRIDVPARQVLIEAHIVEADDTFGRNLGVKLGLQHGPNSLDMSWPATGLLGRAPAQMALSLLSAADRRALNFELSAMEAQGLGQVLSNPRVVTADKARAVIEQGTELPYQSTLSNGSTAVHFRRANLRLEVAPQITPQGQIVMDLDINKDGVGQSTTSGFAIDTKHVKTQVRVDDGGSVLIAGIFEQQQREDQAGVPLLRDLPWLGALFRTQQQVKAKKELLIFISPQVLNTSPAGAPPVSTP